MHSLIGVAFLSGLIGRWYTLRAAAHSADVASLHALLRLSSRFERMVIVGGNFVLIFGVATAIAQGRPFFGPIQGARVDWLFAALLIYVSALPLVPLVFLPRGRAFGAALADATSRGVITDELRAAFHDRVVFGAHAYELVASFTVLALMIAKPF